MEPLPPKRRARPTSIAPVPDPAHESPVSDTPGGLAQGVSEFTQLALWMAASVAGLVTAVLLGRRPYFESLARRVGRPARKPAQAPTHEQALPMLADAIVGNTKSAVASVFGPPRAAVAVDPKKAAPSFWDADTWYYPLPKGGKLAIAIQFEEDFAKGVQFLQAPRT